MQSRQPAVLILWLEPFDLEQIGSLAADDKLSQKIFLSAKMLDYSFGSIPDGLRDNVYLTYPTSLPDTKAQRMVIIKRWLQIRKIPATDLDMQARIYFLGWMLPGAMRYMRSEFFREYFLEGFDMMIDQDYAVAFSPRLTFGPGQRYAAKGCYIVQLSKGSIPKILKKSDWVIY